MKKLMMILSASVMLLSMAALSIAQEPGPGGPGGGPGGPGGPGGGARRGGGGNMMGQVKKLMEKIQPPLSDKQKDAIKALDKKFADKMKDMKDVPQEERREKMKSMMDDYRTALNKILTKDQQASLKKLMEDARKNRGAGGPKGGKRGGAPAGGGAASGDN